MEGYEWSKFSSFYLSLAASIYRDIWSDEIIWKYYYVWPPKQIQQSRGVMDAESESWQDKTIENNGSPPQSPLHLVHLSDVPHPAGTEAGQESEMELVHSLHTSVALRYHTSRQIGFLHDLRLPGHEQRPARKTEDHHEEGLPHLPCPPVDRSSDHVVHQAGWQWHWHIALLRHDTGLDNSLHLHHRCVPIFIWKVINNTILSSTAFTRYLYGKYNKFLISESQCNRMTQSDKNLILSWANYDQKLTSAFR